MPSRVLHANKTACRNFIWCGKESKRSLTLISWQEMCLDYFEEGLNFKEVVGENKAPLIKLLWNLSKD